MQSGHSHDHHDHSHGHSHEGHSHEGHSHDAKDMVNNAIIVAGIMAFFMIEKFTHSYLGVEHSHDHKSKDLKKADKKGEG